MDELIRLLVVLGLAGAGITLLGAGVIWSRNEGRRIRRSLAHVLGDAPHAELVAHGRGRAVGFNFVTNQLAVTWDRGDWCLIYRQDELRGAELIVDDRVMARVHRGEPRLALDQMAGAAALVRLRLVLDDPANPDFDLDLWRPEDERRRKAMTAGEAVHEANRWLARIEALLRRPALRRQLLAKAPQTEAPPLDFDGADDEDVPADNLTA